MTTAERKDLGDEPQEHRSILDVVKDVIDDVLHPDHDKPEDKQKPEPKKDDEPKPEPDPCCGTGTGF